MKPEQIFIGNIKRCTKYEEYNTIVGSTYIGNQLICTDSFGYITKEDELYKENAVLIKIENGGYVDLDRFNSFLDYIRIHKDITKNGYRLGGLMMSTSAHSPNCLFVDEKSLKPYYTDKQQFEDISVRKLKRQVKSVNSL